MASRESGNGQRKLHFGHTTSSQSYIIIICRIWDKIWNMDFQNVAFVLGRSSSFFGGHQEGSVCNKKVD